ncbi:MAG: ElyC/SanA/YdcF family protein [Bacteroidota bacterium]
MSRLRVLSRRLIRWSLVLGGLLAVAVALSNWWIISSARGRLFSDADKIPFRPVGLVLGANKTAGGGINLYFKYRIEAAAALFRAGKIKHIIVSGDNHIREYDEATDMMKALVELGIPDSCITLDYAGFRTLDSVVRCKKVFGQDAITIISQEFHNQRALFIASGYGMDAVAYNAQDVPARYSFKTDMREYFAKFKAVLDLYVLHTSPRFLGEKVEVRIN